MDTKNVYILQLTKTDGPISLFPTFDTNGSLHSLATKKNLINSAFNFI